MKKKGGIFEGNIANPHQIIPIAYQWARECYRCGIANTWVPEEISMHNDVEWWQGAGLSEGERRVVLRNLGFFSTAESLTANNIVLALYRHIANAECRQYLLRQAFEEAVHTDTFIYCCETLLLDPKAVYGAYQHIPSVKAKDEFVISLTEELLDKDFLVTSVQSMQKLIKNIIGFYVVMEGIFFYAGFAMMLALKRENKMTGIGQQFEYIMRDESIHIAFGSSLIATIIAENPSVWTEELQREVSAIIEKAVALEDAYIDDTIPDSFLFYRSDHFKQYVRYIADKRYQRLGMEKRYKAKNPFLWLSESTDLSKEKNFFETKVTEYQTGSLEWDHL